MSANTEVVVGSLGAIAERTGQSIAVTFMSAEIIVVVDVSGSMNTPDARESQTRYTVACQELAALQAKHPGEVAVVSFSDHAQFCPGGVPLYLGAGTDLAAVLQFVKFADGTVRFVVISDGEPNDTGAALTVARTFTSRIDTVYVGPEGGSGAAFLRRLSPAAGGRYVTIDVGQLCSKVEQLLLTA